MRGFRSFRQKNRGDLECQKLSKLHLKARKYGKKSDLVSMLA